jgi:probable phosphoglycerate mutase
MLRPKETAELILQYHSGIPLELEDKFREINHGLWEGKLESEINQEYADLLHQWKVAPATVQMPNGENLNQVWERATAAWDRMIQVKAGMAESELKTGLVVAHDAINKVILCHVLGLSSESFWSIKQGNGGVSVIEYTQGLDKLPVVQAMNITTHLSGDIFDRTAAGAL